MVLSLMYNLYIVESFYLLVGDVEQRVIGWVVAEVKHVGVQAHVPVKQSWASLPYLVLM